MHPVEWTLRHLELLECSFEEATLEPALGSLQGMASSLREKLEENVNARFVRQLASRRGRGAPDFEWREAQLGRIITSDERFSIHYRCGPHTFSSSWCFDVDCSSQGRYILAL